MPVTGAVAQRRDEVAAEVPRSDLSLDEMEYHIVEHGSDDFVHLRGRNAHATRLIPQQRSVDEKHLTDRGFVGAQYSGDEKRGRRITRGADRFIVFAPSLVAALIQWILPSPPLVMSSASLTDAHQGVTSRGGESTRAASSRSFSRALPTIRAAPRARGESPSAGVEIPSPQRSRGSAAHHR